MRTMPTGGPNPARQTLSGPPRATRAVRRAEQQAELGQIPEAIQSLEKALQFGADRYDCYLRIAKLHQTCGRWLEAVSAAQRAIAEHPDRLSAHEAVIALFLESRDYARAVSASLAMLKRFPRHVPARDALGAAYIGLGDMEAAMRVAGDLIRIDPTDPTHRFKKAILCQHQGELRMAIEEFQRVVDMAPDTDLAQSAREQLDLLDLHQLRGILLLASEDTVFRGKLVRDSELAIAERGFCLSEVGRQRLDELADFELGDVPANAQARMYH
jgi:tetratricopeptide (TPR) repeat protein